MILSGQTIEELLIIYPFRSRTVEFGMTYGAGPAGYDVRIEFDANGTFGGLLLEPDGKIILVSTIEQFCMPTNVIGVVHDKSTWARKGLLVQNTIIEPGWCGYLTLELTNQGYEFINLERGMPIAQVVFHYLDQPTNLPYSGKYQNQLRGPQQAK